jgi:hypothetical protein
LYVIWRYFIWHNSYIGLNVFNFYVTRCYLTGLYYGVSICLVSFASGMSVVTLNVYHRGVRGTGVPRMIKALVLGKLARLVFLQFEPRDKHGPSMQHVSYDV